ncbi:MAG: ABC transporter permease subunit [Bdellovibrionota bacterium]
MISCFITNPLTLKRWNRFCSIKRAVMAAWLFAFLIFLSITAEFWANNKPLIMSYQGQTYFPSLKTYHPTVFGQEDIFVTDYRALNLTENGNWAIWPIVKWDPFESNNKVEVYPGPPSNENWFGTDDRGRDVLSRLLYGFRYSFIFSIFVWLISFFIGVVIGAVMGFAGGKVDLWGQRLVEIFDSVPTLLLLITLMTIFGANMWLLIVFSSFFGWMMISIYMRAEFLRLRNRDFVESAKALGASRARLIFKHILPNAMGPLITFSPFAIAGGIASLAALDYLGFGLPPPTPSWGELLGQAQKNFTIAWWLAVYPSLALFVSLVVLNLIGEGVREAFDPRKS